jgi:hypothetical protein
MNRKSRWVVLALALLALVCIVTLEHQNTQPGPGPDMCYANGYGWMKQAECDRLMREGKVKPPQ